MSLKITITGGKREGKTTLAAILVDVLSRRNYSVVVNDGYLTDEKECDEMGNLLFHKILDGVKKKPIEAFEAKGVTIDVKETSVVERKKKARIKDCNQGKGNESQSDMNNLVGDEAAN